MTLQLQLHFLVRQVELDNSYSYRPSSWERTIRITLKVLSGCLPLAGRCNVK